jgi:hypothetical protein
VLTGVPERPASSDNVRPSFGTFDRHSSNPRQRLR